MLMLRLPANENHVIDERDMPKADRELFDVLSQALFESAVTRYTPDGRPWLKALWSAGLDVSPVGTRIVEADRLRKLRSIADLLSPVVTRDAIGEGTELVPWRVGPTNDRVGALMLAAADSGDGKRPTSKEVADLIGRSEGRVRGCKAWRKWGTGQTFGVWADRVVGDKRRNGKSARSR